MVSELLQVLREKNVLFHENSGITICRVANKQDGFSLAAELLYNIVDRRTVLYLSGGKTPKELYKNLAKEEKLVCGAVGLIDERYGERYHGNSNEKMIRDTGLLRYFKILDIPIYPILGGGSRAEIAAEYDARLRSLHSIFPKHVGILGIGIDGHTAGLPAGNKVNNLNNLVVEYDDVRKRYGERVTMSFLGLSMLDVLLVLVFGRTKKQALEFIFSDGSEDDIPGRFYKRSEIAQRTLLITDQQI